MDDLLEELQALHIREAEILSRQRNSLSSSDGTNATRNLESNGPVFLDSRGQRLLIGDEVAFAPTSTVSGGTGTITGYTKGTDPFLRIRRRKEGNSRFHVNREVRRKPRNVTKA